MGTQKLLHQLKDHGRPARHLRPARPADAHQLRGAARRDRAEGPGERLQRRASRSRRRSTPTSTPTSSRCATARAPTRCRCMQTVLTDGDGPRPALADLAQGDVARRSATSSSSTTSALVRADRHRAGHADARQLDHHLRQLKRRSAGSLTSKPGPRRAEPDLDPGRQRGGPTDGRAHGRHGRAARSASRSTCR